LLFGGFFGTGTVVPINGECATAGDGLPGGIGHDGDAAPQIMLVAGIWLALFAE